MFEIIHFLPMLALILACLMGFHKSVKGNAIIFSISMVGILFGSFFHHSHAVTMFDPCIISITVALYSIVNLVRVIALKKKEA